MENYYRNFYPYNFYPPNFRTYTYGKERFRQNQYYKNEKASSNKSNYENEPVSEKNEAETRKIEDRSGPIFEIFGIKLFFDDILLISLIFFLYSEGVKDQNLFIALILLLLS